MKVLVLGHGISSDGVVNLLSHDNIDYDYLDVDEVTSFNYLYVVKSPGIPFDSDIIIGFLKFGIEVITDIELAYRLRKKIYIGVTGSNGKTTTVSLINEILKTKYEVVCCGNIGYSVCQALLDYEDCNIFIVECSSFQLEASKVCFDISVLLNVNPSHLDHHNSFDDYIKAKSNICRYLNNNSIFIYNGDDDICKSVSNITLANKYCFSYCCGDCFIKSNKLYYKSTYIIDVDDFSYGFVYDVMASVLVSVNMGIDIDNIREVIKNFKPVIYRFNKINDYIYNDAKSTNPYSTISALCKLDNVFLICGGYDRKEDLSCLDNYLDKIKKVFCYGDTKNKIFDYFKMNNKECFIYNNLEEALKDSLAKRVDEIILFSPMFASYDQFENYEQRGKIFSELCQKLL